DDLCKLKEECSLSVTCEAVRISKSILLRNASDTERLAWEACDQNIVIRNRAYRFFGLRDFADVFVEGMIADREVRRVCLSGIFVPSTGRDAPPPYGIEGKPHPADTSEQVYVGELRVSHASRGTLWTPHLAVLFR